jgi:hypothetical protein
MAGRYFSRRVLAVVVLLVGATVAITLLVRFFRGPDRETYLAKNERIVQSLPRPPGAHEIGRQILSIEESWGEQFSYTVGYTTHVSYAVPNTRTDADVVGFYKKRMSGWRRESWTVDRLLFACFDRNGATVAIDTTGMELLGGATRKTYGIAVTHAGGTCD